jgi:oxygen-dependent protoporphyrinogen oxidase
VNSNHHDVIIVGGGIAGLAAAWTLRDRDILLLEREALVGGRLRSERRGPYWVNLGAHIFGGEQSLATVLGREMGLEFLVPQGSISVVAIKGQIVRGGLLETLPFRLPLSLPARISLIRVGLRLKVAEFMARRADPRGQIPRPDFLPPLDVLPVDKRLDGMSFRKVLGPMHPEVEELMRVIANRISGEIDSISGQHGAASSIGLWGHRRPVLVGGSGLLPQALHERLGKRVRTNTRVQRLEQSKTAVHAEVDMDGVRQDLTADYCVVAVPPSVVREVVQDLPKEKDAALAQVRCAPWVVAGLFTKETVPMPWDDIYAMAVPGRSFCFLFNPANAVRTSSQRAPGGSLVVYTAGDRAGDLSLLPDAEIQEHYLNDLYGLFPEARGIVDEVVIRRWPCGVPIFERGRGGIQQQLAARCGRLYFAGDYLMCPGIDLAMWTGVAAAQAIQARQRQQVGKP